jgi:Uma2 family endonuclease
MAVQPEQRLFTVEEYHRMAEAGILDPDERVELVEGVILPMAAIGRRHLFCTDWLNTFFAARLVGRAIVRVQGSAWIGPRSEPEPDLQLLRWRDDFYLRGDFTIDDILLLVEVSDASLARDRVLKLGVYARAGVKEYWIVDLVADLVEVYREPSADGYASKTVVERGQSLAPMAFPELVLDTGELIPDRI